MVGVLNVVELERKNTHTQNHHQDFSAFVFAVPRRWVCWSVWRQGRENSCQSGLPGGENLKCPTFSQSGFLEQSHVTDSNLSARWATAPELSSCCRCTTRGSSPPWMKARAQIPTRSPQSAVRWSSQQTSLSHHGIPQPRWGDLMSIWWTGALLCSFVMQAVSLLEEVVIPRKELPPLLLKLSERRAERLDYLGVSYGLTTQLLRWGPFSLEMRILNIVQYKNSNFSSFQVLEESRL